MGSDLIVLKLGVSVLLTDSFSSVAGPRVQYLARLNACSFILIKKKLTSDVYLSLEKFTRTTEKKRGVLLA